ncbi:MAG TPA: molybdopterin-binding protein, partial [Stellaceae bacterium]
VTAGSSDAARSRAARRSVADAAAWIDAEVAPLAPETIALAHAAGRVLAQDAVASAAVPPTDQAAIDGFALHADETAGASAYNPLSFRLAAHGAALVPGATTLVSAGDLLPGGADAVVALEHVQPGPSGSGEVIDAVVAGYGVAPRGSLVMPGTTLLEARRWLHPHDIGLLAAAGIERIPVIGRPRVWCLLPARLGAGAGAPPVDANGPLLQALIERDGGDAVELRRIACDRVALAQALRAADADLVIVAGGTGRGADDHSAAALAEAGELAMHGMALNPGETAGLGRTAAGVPVLLLPGAPAACLWAYELVAGRAVRRRAGRDPALPFRRREMTTARKIVSAIGMTEIVPVRCLSEERVEPIASAAAIAAAVRPDGFVIVAEGSEGAPAGAVVAVYLSATS